MDALTASPDFIRANEDSAAQRLSSTSRLIQRRPTSFFEFGLPSPPWMAYALSNKFMQFDDPSVIEALSEEWAWILPPINQVLAVSTMGNVFLKCEDQITGGSARKSLPLRPSRERLESLMRFIRTPNTRKTGRWPAWSLI